MIEFAEVVVEHDAFLSKPLLTRVPPRDDHDSPVCFIWEGAPLAPRSP